MRNILSINGMLIRLDYIHAITPIVGRKSIDGGKCSFVIAFINSPEVVISLSAFDLMDITSLSKSLSYDVREEMKERYWPLVEPRLEELRQKLVVAWQESERVVPVIEIDKTIPENLR